LSRAGGQVETWQVAQELPDSVLGKEAKQQRSNGYTQLSTAQMETEATKKLLHCPSATMTFAGHDLDTLRINRNQRKLTGDKDAVKSDKDKNCC
tara:strand:- start:2 stop:283 length:282 start_codon:yes stop_codon:yes gene_type:complete